MDDERERFIGQRAEIELLDAISLNRARDDRTIRIGERDGSPWLYCVENTPSLEGYFKYCVNDLGVPEEEFWEKETDYSFCIIRDLARRVLYKPALYTGLKERLAYMAELAAEGKQGSVIGEMIASPEFKEGFRTFLENVFRRLEGDAIFRKAVRG